MKTTIIALSLAFASASYCGEYTFRADLPSVSATNKLTADMFKNSDAVILLKEQSFTEGPHSKLDVTPGGGFTVYVSHEITITSEVIVAKVFNNAGVEHFGSFEYEYPYFRDREERHTFNVHARVMKPDSTVWVMPDSAVSTIEGAATGSGKTLTQKTFFKMNNLAPGDIIQIEYLHAAPYSSLRRVLFFYHSRYPVLHSNVIINMDKDVKVDYLSFPPDKVGEPVVKQIGSTISHVWSVSNLSGIPEEPFCRPFDDVSYMTTVINHPDESDGNGWRPLAKDYLRWYVDKGSIPKSFMKQIGLDPSLQNPGWEDINRVYTLLRKYFKLSRNNSLHPGVGALDDIIEEKEGDASDLAYMMLKVLERWGVATTPLLIRDKRDGIYETSVSSLVWFDRLALLVSLQGADRVFDFDRSIPSRFELPWFLNGINVLALHDTGVAHLYINAISSLKEHTSKEIHTVTLSSKKTALDSICFRLRGALAERLRKNLYPLKGEELITEERELIGKYALRDVDTSSMNSFLDESEISLYGKGTSQGAFSAVDSFVTFQPRNHLLREFREKFSASERYDDIFLDEPFEYSLQWIVKAPPGCIISQLPAPASFENPAIASSQIFYLKLNDTTCFVKSEVVFNSARIHQEQYKEFVGIIDNIIQATERDLLFKKR